MKKQNMQKIVIVLISLVLLSSLTSAFGVASAYHKNKPLELARGEVETVLFNLQNMVGEEDVFVRASLIDGHSIAELKETDFEIPIGTHDTNAPLVISIPEDANPGDITKVKVDFKSVSPGTAGGIGFGSGMSFTFDVIVTGEPIVEPEFPWQTIGIIAAFILVGGLIMFLITRRKKRIIETQQNLANM